MENENLNQTKEKMIKRCRTFGNILQVMKWIIVIAVIMIIILIATLGVFIAISSEDTIPDEIIAGGFSSLDENEEEISIFEGIVSIVGTIFSFVLLDSLGKLFLNIAKEGTPFSKNIIKAVKDICVFASIIYVAGIFLTNFNMNLLFLLTIWGMYYIFKYGYQLQLESDETL